ncbi:MAG: hypothetical protein U9Q80_00815, partial [Bacillota bacterium]|nr:hypothetical protein [Bacillota bacterium]
AKLKNTRCDIKIFYAEEKMLDNLIEEIKKSPDQSGIDMYKDMLFDDYPAETLELLIKRVERMAQHTKGRKYYKSIVYELRSILKYPNGEKMVMELISEWRIKYSKRRAMMEELDYIHINHG